MNILYKTIKFEPWLRYNLFNFEKELKLFVSNHAAQKKIYNWYLNKFQLV